MSKLEEELMKILLQNENSETVSVRISPHLNIEERFVIWAEHFWFFLKLYSVSGKVNYGKQSLNEIATLLDCCNSLT